MRRFLVACFLSFVTLSSAALAQSADNQIPSQQPQDHAAPAVTKSRPKIGVALEGGGALGLAHIGVLQWFEDHHIPVDYVAGTSMGGLVGGFYATGKSPAELKQIVERQNWNVIIGGATLYEDLSYRRK